MAAHTRTSVLYATSCGSSRHAHHNCSTICLRHISSIHPLVSPSPPHVSSHACLSPLSCSSSRRLDSQVFPRPGRRARVRGAAARYSARAGTRRDGVPVTPRGVMVMVAACLNTEDATALRRLHPAIAAAVATVPWADTTTTVRDIVRWRAALPAAVGCTLSRGLFQYYYCKVTDGGTARHGDWWRGADAVQSLIRILGIDQCKVAPAQHHSPEAGRRHRVASLPRPHQSCR